MSYEISQRFFFDAAHTLRRDIDASGSARIHGHTYEAEVSLTGTPDARGMVVDLGLLRQAIEGVRSELDHHMLDEVQGLGPATLENLCTYIAQRLRPQFATLSAVRVWRDSVGDACVLRLVPA